MIERISRLEKQNQEIKNLLFNKVVDQGGTLRMSLFGLSDVTGTATYTSGNTLVGNGTSFASAVLKHSQVNLDDGANPHNTYIDDIKDVALSNDLWDEKSAVGGAFYFIDRFTGWAVSGSDIMKTEDGGVTWEIKYTLSVAPDWALHIRFFDSNNGIIVTMGGYCVSTTDGGETWTETFTGLYGYSAFFISPLVGWIGALTESLGVLKNIHRTTDGGVTWTSDYIGAPLISSVFDLHFIDSDTGWAAVSYSKGVFYTTDGGTTWTETTTDIGSTTCVFFISADVGWAAGLGGVVYKSTDGGVTWSSQTSGTSCDLYDIYFTDSNTGWIVGESAILSTTDGGTTWTVTETAGGYWIQAYSEGLAWATGYDSYIYRYKPLTDGQVLTYNGSDWENFPPENVESYITEHETTYDHDNYNTAYGWGDHASAGYFVIASNTMDDISDGTTYVKTHNDYTDAEVSKLSGIEDGADITDSDNVASAGAFMKATDDFDDISNGTYVRGVYVGATAPVDTDYIWLDIS